jgi:hypothetical protein
VILRRITLRDPTLLPMHLEQSFFIEYCRCIGHKILGILVTFTTIFRALSLVYYYLSMILATDLAMSPVVKSLSRYRGHRG